MESENKKDKVELVEQIKQAILDGDHDFLTDFMKNDTPFPDDTSLKDFVKDRDDVWSIYFLGCMYLSGKCGLLDNNTFALDCFYKILNNPFVDVCYKIGYIYYNRNRLFNCKLALKYYKISSKKGNTSSSCNIGYIYFKGDGVEKNYKKAVKYYQLSISQGINSSALNNMGLCYEKGYCVEKDITKAIEFYKKAIKAGSSKSKEHLKQCIKESYNIVDLYLENERLKKENEELKLRPPNVGGAEYEKAKKKI